MRIRHYVCVFACMHVYVCICVTCVRAYVCVCQDTLLYQVGCGLAVGRRDGGELGSVGEGKRKEKRKHLAFISSFFIPLLEGRGWRRDREGRPDSAQHIV